MKFRLWQPIFLLVLLTGLCSCSLRRTTSEESESGSIDTNISISSSGEVVASSLSTPATPDASSAAPAVFNPTSVPAYAEEPSIELNGGRPFFSEEELQEALSFLFIPAGEPAESESSTESTNSAGQTTGAGNVTTLVSFSELDEIGRAGAATVLLNGESLTTAERQSIANIRPSGWHTVKYDGIEWGYLYNRCHLLGYYLTGDNGDPRNLITGTRYLNIQGMQPHENRVANYLRRKDACHVLYRVTPVFDGDNLLASGVLMEAMSVEDSGASLSLCVYCYNVQPGIIIDYATGESDGPPLTGDSLPDDSDRIENPDGPALHGAGGEFEDANAPSAGNEETVPAGTTYIANTSSMKFHLPNCEAVSNMAAHNRLYFTGTREELLELGYDPCNFCRP